MDLEDRHRLNPEGFARQERARDLETEIATLAAHIHAASYRLIELLGEFEAVRGWEGWPSPAHWLQWRCGFSLNAAREKFRVARALPSLPLIRAEFERGALSFAQVRAMTRVATPDNEATVLMWARHSTASQLERFARLYRRHGENAAALAQHRERSFSHWEEDEGMVNFRIRLPADQAAVVLKAVAAAKDSLDGRDREELVLARTGDEVLDEEGETLHPDEDVSAETRRARRADAFVRVMESYLEPGARRDAGDPAGVAIARSLLPFSGLHAHSPCRCSPHPPLGPRRRDEAVQPRGTVRAPSPPAARGRLWPEGDRRRGAGLHTAWRRADSRRSPAAGAHR